jgi:hypothetical protein
MSGNQSESESEIMILLLTLHILNLLIINYGGCTVCLVAVASLSC